MIKISTSILSADNKELCINKLNKTNTDYIHIDIMDNTFVKNSAFSLEEVSKISHISNKKLDIHLMVDNPEQYIKSLNYSNIDSITFHIEINQDINYLIDLIKSKQYNVGLAIKPETDIKLIDKYLSKIDKILVMSVEPGYGGQEFLPSTINRVKELKKFHKVIEVDGGINNETIRTIKNNIDIAVSGSYITNHEDYQKAINNLKN